MRGGRKSDEATIGHLHSLENILFYSYKAFSHIVMLRRTTVSIRPFTIGCNLRSHRSTCWTEGGKQEYKVLEAGRSDPLPSPPSSRPLSPPSPPFKWLPCVIPQISRLKPKVWKATKLNEKLNYLTWCCFAKAYTVFFCVSVGTTLALSPLK